MGENKSINSFIYIGYGYLSGQKFSPGDSAEPRHTGEKFLIPWVRYPYPTWILMMDSYNLTYVT